MNETIFHRPAPDAPCFCVGYDGHDPECACTPASGGVAQNTLKTLESVTGAQIGALPKAIINAIENLAGGEHHDCVQQLLALLQPYFAGTDTTTESTACDAVLQNRPQIIPEIIPGSWDPWIWSDDELPPVDVPVLCIDPDNVDNLGQVEVVTRAGGIENNKEWVEYPAWWMRIPPAPGVTS